MKKNILLVMLEFDNWEQGRSWSYTGSYAFLDGLRANGHNCTLLPAIHDRKPDAPDSFIHHAETLLAGKTFDEAWIWCNHASFDDRFWSWLKRVAPVRVGVILESLSHTDQELRALPFLAKRKVEAFESLRHCTHALAVDEADVDEIVRVFGIPAIQNIFMVPERFVRHDDPPESRMAAFIGAAYFTGSAYSFPDAPELPRNKYLNDPALAELMNRPHFQLPERSSDALRRFEVLNADMRQRMQSGELDEASYQAFTEELPKLREALFAMLLEGFRLGMASVNLPSLAKAYSGRVIEAMAASVPSVSWRPPARPACAGLFTEGREIVLFDSVAELADKLTRLRDNPEMRASLVTAARECVLARHTSRIRCDQYSRWIATGTTPDF